MSVAPAEDQPPELPAQFELLLAKELEDSGWVKIDDVVRRFNVRQADVTQAIRTLTRNATQHVIETRTHEGVSKVRITQVEPHERTACQMSADVIEILAKLKVDILHSTRSRKSLAKDVENIAARMQPYLDQGQFNRLKNRRRLKLLARQQHKAEIEKRRQPPE